MTVERKALDFLLEIYPQFSASELELKIKGVLKNSGLVEKEDDIIEKVCELIENGDSSSNLGRLNKLQSKIDLFYRATSDKTTWDLNLLDKTSATTTTSRNTAASGTSKSTNSSASNKSIRRKLVKYTESSPAKKPKLQEKTIKVSSDSDDPDDDLIFKQQQLLSLLSFLKSSNSLSNSQLLLTELFNNSDIANALISCDTNFSSFQNLLDYFKSFEAKFNKALAYFYEYYDQLMQLSSVFSDCSKLSNILVQEFRSIIEHFGPSITSSATSSVRLSAQPPFLDKSLKLKDYQLIGVNWLLLLHKHSIGGILADEMGLGKTCQVICFIGMVKLSSLSGQSSSFEDICMNLLEKRKYITDNDVDDDLLSSKKLDSIEIDDDEEQEEEYDINEEEEQDDVNNESGQLNNNNINLDVLDSMERFLIVVPASVLKNWKREFKKWCPILNVQIYSGDQKDRMNLQRTLFPPTSSQGDDFKPNNFDVLLTSYNTMQQIDRSFLRRCKFSYMILDEGHMLKNSGSQRFLNLMRLKIKNRILLTGTPLQNNLKELITLLSFCIPSVFNGKEEVAMKMFSNNVTGEIGLNYAEFKKGLNEESEWSDINNLLYTTKIEKARIIMTPFVLRRRKEQVLKEMPKKTEYLIKCKPTKFQMRVYNRIIGASDMEHDSTKKITKKQRSNILMLLRLISCHPLLGRTLYKEKVLVQMAKTLIRKEETYWDAVEEYIYEDMKVMTDFELSLLAKQYKSLSAYELENMCDKEGGEKLDWLMESGKVVYLMEELLPKCFKNKDKVLLFSQFRMVLDVIEQVLKRRAEYTYLRLDGETEVEKRQELIDQYQGGEVFMFLLSTKAGKLQRRSLMYCLGGFGINLTEANVVILYDLDFNPHNDRQAEDRAHRVGQTREVSVYKLICGKSIEEAVHKMGKEKLELDQKVQGKVDMTKEVYGMIEEIKEDEDNAR